MKKCSGCNIEKDFTDFYGRLGTRDNLNYRCKACCIKSVVSYTIRHPEKRRKQILKYNKKHSVKLKEYHRKRHLIVFFNITKEQYESMLLSQNSSCAICGIHQSDKKQHFAIDHDHACCKGIKSCGKCIRGLLCFNCNDLLGRAQDQTDILQKAIKYLEK